MRPIEKMTSKGKEMFMTFIHGNANTHIPEDCYSVDCDWSRHADADFILRYWNDNKEELFNILGQNLQIFKSVKIKKTAEIDEQLKRERICQFTGSSLYHVLASIKKACSHALELKILLDWANNSILVPSFSNSINITEKIVICGGSKEAYFSTSKFADARKKLVLQPETKLTKALKMIIDFLNLKEKFPTIKENYEKACIEISQFMQNQAEEMDETFLFSIHPLDFLTMSDHSATWTSCMSWKNGGCYRMGTVEMMNSPMIVEVACLEKMSRFTIQGQRWNDKKWRTLLIVTPGFISTIKSYPYACPQLEQYAIAEMASMCNEYYSKEIYNIKDVKVATRGETSLPYRCVTRCMYNDTGLTTHYYYYNEEVVSKEFEKLSSRYPNNFFISFGSRTINYSGQTECMCCGEEVKDLEDSGLVLCDDCLLKEEVEYCYCDECGSYIEDGEEITMSDGKKFCRNCAADRFYFDDYNEQWLYEDECIFIDCVAESRWGVYVEQTLVVKKENFGFISSYFDYKYKNILTKVFEWHLERGLSCITIPYAMCR